MSCQNVKNRREWLHCLSFADTCKNHDCFSSSYVSSDFFKDTEGPLKLQSCQCSLEVSGDVNDELDGTVYLFLNINYRPLTTIYISRVNHLSGQRLKTGAWTKYRIYTNIFKRLYSGSKSHTGAKQATIDNILCNWFRFLAQDIINTGREYIKRKGRDS